MIKIGHRGAMGYSPQNTLLSFEKAIELGVDMIELDVHVCLSGELVVIHNPKVNWTTSGHGIVANMSLEQLKLLDAGDGQKIPTLREVLNLVKRRAKVNIELKAKGTPQKVADIIDQYVNDQNWSYGDFTISSFQYDLLEEFHKLMPKVKIGVLTETDPKECLDFAKSVGANSVNYKLKFVNEKLVNMSHKLGFKVFVWTVNKTKDIERLKKIGVDGIFSNFPDRVS